MNSNIAKSQERSKAIKWIFPFLIFIFCAVWIVANQSLIRKSIENSLKLCLSSIIPAIFPFMILSEYITSSISVKSDSKWLGSFKKTFSICGIGVIPFLIGNVCGFPLGAQITKKLYDKECISKEEYERLLPLCSNPSFAFVVSGVGGGMRGSIFDGVMLYTTILMATVISGIIWKRNNSASDFYGYLDDSVFSLSSSIKSSAQSCIYVSAYIIFFSTLAGWIEYINIPRIISLILISFLEIGTASSLISRELSDHCISLSLTAFSLGFSGISVYMQSLCFSPSGVKNRYYIKMKLTEGIIASAIMFLIYNFI